MSKKLPIIHLARNAGSTQRDHVVPTDQLSGLTPALNRVVWILALVLFVVLPAHGQQTEDVQKQIQQLKQQYEQTTRELQERIAALEQQLKKEGESKEKRKDQGVVSEVERAAQAAFGQNEKQQPLQGQLPSAPTYELLRDADTKIEKL